MGNIAGVDLGTFGVWTFDFEHQPAAQMRDSIQELEAQGWRAFWIPELLGREALTHAGYLLSCTQQMHIINGIARIGHEKRSGLTAPAFCWPTPIPTVMSSVWVTATRGRGQSPLRP
jgi:hypothetical protein